MLKIENLTIKYGSKKEAVKNFSLDMKKGEIICIVGESGSGKSTVLKAVMGLLPINSQIVSGKILFKNEEILQFSEKKWESLRGTVISMISQDCGGTLNPIRKIGSQYIEYIQNHIKISKYEAYVKALTMLKKVRLPNPENIINSYPHQLSGGMKQRVGIAIALTFKPEIILADEPTSALDVTTQAQIIKQMLEIRKEFESGILMVTHNLGIASYMADKLIVMQDGNIIDVGNREEIIKNSKNEYTKKLLNSIPEIDGDRFV